MKNKKQPRSTVTVFTCLLMITVLFFSNPASTLTVDTGGDTKLTDDPGGAVLGDGILIAQSAADSEYFLKCVNRPFSAAQQRMIGDGILKAYRWQYIVSGVQDPRFTGILGELTTAAQMSRITTALAPLM